MTDKIEIEKIRINLKANKAQLLNKKNSLVAKKKELRTKIAILNIVNVPVRNH